MSRWMVSGEQLRHVLGEGRINTWDHSMSEFALTRSDLQSLTEAGPPEHGVPPRSEISCYGPSLSATRVAIRAVRCISFFWQWRRRVATISVNLFDIVNEAVQANPADPALQILLRNMKQIASQRQ